MDKNDTLDWQAFGKEFVKISSDEQIDMTLSNWQTITKDYQGKSTVYLDFDCMEENGLPCNKKYQTSSKRLARLFKPIIEEAKEKNETTIRVRLLKMGEGISSKFSLNRIYSGDN
ncbi:hypothetical protein HOK68_03835 [Candidatus Woesearchaeota archaeon]|jgi:hypothetical protein|nr:hypothetical protein [Candidatus Woesearchaeota archaeon]MBT4387893.1 hypothetical protein [Candidatus Woesearchaeota archaeon]MBT4595712.1 hypothetical protein [Candidatus Woesearchaeota archaeon]MBT5741439.1 hypothetical protein [Candidatus Woesearchaeota archaeon]MBT6505880.1 hypothetical protein [Candidatus Woesearchaeota archaeon]